MNIFMHIRAWNRTNIVSNFFLYYTKNLLKHIVTSNSLSRISHENMPGLSRFNLSILVSTSGVATRGLLPPITPGLIDPVSWYLLRIFETQPWETRSWREITQGRTPAAAISTIFRRIRFGSGRPFINTPPNWFIRPWPEIQEKNSKLISTINNNKRLKNRNPFF